MKEAKNKPTATEVKAAIEVQAPVTQLQGDDAPPDGITTTEWKNRAVQRVNTFAQLAKVSRDARITFGGNAQWIQPANLFNENYHNGDVSVPFYVTRAWKFTSKQGYGERLGLEIALSNGRMYNVALGLNDGDIKRNDLLAMFSERNAPPIGPVVMQKLPLAKGNDYYDIVPQDDQASGTNAEIPFVEINDKDIPF